GQVVVGDLQDDAGHGGAVVGADQVLPGAVVALAADQLVADGGEPFLPVLAAGGPHRLGGVVVAVEVVHVVAAGELARRLVLHEEVEALLEVLVVVDAGGVQGADAGGGAGERLPGAAAGLGHVAEPALAAVLAAADVLDAVVHLLLRHRDAGVAGRPQGHDL